MTSLPSINLLTITNLFAWQVEVNRQYRVHRVHEAVATSDYIKTRSIFLREQLPRGRYVVVPTTFRPLETGDFLLRLFSSKDYDAT